MCGVERVLCCAVATSCASRCSGRSGSGSVSMATSERAEEAAVGVDVDVSECARVVIQLRCVESREWLAGCDGT